MFFNLYVYTWCATKIPRNLNFKIIKFDCVFNETLAPLTLCYVSLGKPP